MRKLLAVLFLPVFLFTGCAKPASPTQSALDLRTRLMNCGGCSFTAQIAADLGQQVYHFTVECDYDTEDGAVVTVKEPEEIAGITARVSPDGCDLEFDGMALAVGELAGGRVSPLSACWLLGSCWTGAYIQSGGKDENLERITYLDGYDEEELTMDTWLNESGVPVHCEVTYDSLRCLTIELTDFVFHN